MKILTANRLTDGEAVWLDRQGLWAETIVNARIADDKAAADRLEEIGKAAYAANEVVDVNLIDVELVDNAIRPLRLREQIRAAGPTTHPHFGKQSRSSATSADWAEGI